MNKEWYEIRDLLFGQNYRKQDIAKALCLTKECKHPDAVLISDATKQQQVYSREALIKAFLEYWNNHNDVRAICFAWCLLEAPDQFTNMEWLNRASDAGFAFAQTQKFWKMYYTPTDTDLKALAESAVSQNERDGYWCLMKLYEHSLNQNARLEAAKKGAELGITACMSCLGRASENLLDAISWVGKAAVLGDVYLFKQLFERLEIWTYVTNSRLSVYLAGYYAKKIFKLPRLEAVLFLRASHAIKFYTAQLFACRSAVDTWSLCAMRLKLYKDIRVLIAKIVWDSRSEALFDIPQ